MRTGGGFRHEHLKTKHPAAGVSAPIVVVGAGQAAATFAVRHAALGNPQPALLLGDESHPPYERPPLSKKFLVGKLERERLPIRPQEWYDAQGIATRWSTRVARIERDARQVVTDGGERIDYDKLLLCIGASARGLPRDIGGDLPGVFTLRTIADVERLAPELKPGRRLLIVGGGYIGLEVAASARGLGLDVTIVEMAERILQRIAAAPTSDYFRELHRAHGVDLRESARMTRLLEAGGRVAGAELEGGETLLADVVLVGIGASPNTALAEAAGLACDNGIVVDECCRTADPDIFAAGDCCNFPRDGARVRLESVQNAADQGDLIARVLAGEDTRYDAVPWFWSDQYDCMLQIAGLNLGHTDTVVRRDSDPGVRSVWYYAGDRLLAVDAINDTRAYVFGRKLIELGKHPPPEIVAAPTTDLKALVKG